MFGDGEEKEQTRVDVSEGRKGEVGREFGMK